MRIVIDISEKLEEHRSTWSLINSQLDLITHFQVKNADYRCKLHVLREVKKLRTLMTKDVVVEQEVLNTLWKLKRFANGTTGVFTQPGDRPFASTIAQALIDIRTIIANNIQAQVDEDVLANIMDKKEFHVVSGQEKLMINSNNLTESNIPPIPIQQNMDLSDVLLSEDSNEDNQNKQEVYA